MMNNSDSRPFDDTGADSGGHDDGADSEVHDADADPEVVVYTREDGEPPAHSVIEAVAEVTQRDPTELRPLYEVIDTDALDDLVTGGSERVQAADELRIAFQFEGCDVAVYADGRTVVSRSLRG